MSTSNDNKPKRKYYFCQRCAIYVETMFLNWGNVRADTMCPVCACQILHETPPIEGGAKADYTFYWYRPPHPVSIPNMVVMESDEYLKNGGLILCDLSGDPQKQPLTNRQFQIVELEMDRLMPQLASLSALEALRKINETESKLLSQQSVGV